MAGLNLFTNNAATTLASAINSTVTSLSVASGTGTLFPTLTGSQYFYCTLATNAGTVEIVKVTARSTDTFTIVRGQDGTSAVSWSSGDKVELRLTNADLLNFPQLDSTNTFALAQTFTTAPVFTDQAGTRTAMAAAKSGANSDITSLTACTTITGLTTPLSVAQGGTGASTLTSNNVILGNGTSAVAFVAPGTTGNILTSNGTTWTSAAASGGQLQSQLFTAPGTWTKPASATQVKVTVVGGGGGGIAPPSGSAGDGGVAVALTPVSGPVTITVGAGGNAPGNPGSTSSFGSAISATGGTGASPAPVTGKTASGVGTVTTGTSLRVSTNLTGPKTVYSSSGALINSVSLLAGTDMGTYSPSNPYPATAQAFSSTITAYAGNGGSGNSPTTTGTGVGGIGGAVLVEFIG